jgi:SnoaL-like polyketide cyclase
MTTEPIRNHSSRVVHRGAAGPARGRAGHHPENDLVVVRLVVTATVKGCLLGVPADGKPVRWDAVDIYRVTDGKISEEWAADDIATIMAQIGAFNPPWAA